MKESRQVRPVIFGEVLFDRFPGGHAVLGGAPFNVAWNLRALQADPLLISRVGQDALGDRILAAMQEWSLDTRGLQRDAQHATGTVEVTIRGGEPAYDIASEKAYDFITAEELPELPGTGILYHGSLALRSQTSRETLPFLRHEIGASIFLDVNLRAPWWRRDEILKLIDTACWIKLNESELAELVPAAEGLEARSQVLFDRSALECLVITRGEKGVWFADRHGTFIAAEAPRVPEVVDTVGAGDAFSSVVMLGLLHGWDWPIIFQRALAFAAAVVGLQGATTTDPSFYESFIKDWEHS